MKPPHDAVPCSTCRGTGLDKRFSEDTRCVACDGHRFVVIVQGSTHGPFYSAGECYRLTYAG